IQKEKTMTVTARSLKNLQVQIQANNHAILADEPLHDGGEDQGPSPYDLLLSSLAACKVMTVHLYARRKQWPVETVTISLNHRKISADECDDCETQGKAKVDIIDCEISFEGDLDETQIARLAEIADRCPVHRTLTSETKIRTTVI
ncbi:MAG: OsmC family protein, partial [Anaerolineales bacterium]|nr:OsmC family protein [Anaerolineales bacterium]